MCARDRVQSRGETPGAVVEVEGSGGPAEGHGRSNLVIGKGAAATVIRKK